MSQTRYNTWLHRFALLTALMTLGLVGIGGLVTSKGVGMAVPDWPTSYGYNMFALPISTWFTGGVFHEHTHRLWASWVGVLVVMLTRWLGGRESRLPLAIIGATETGIGLALPLLGPDWKGAGYFLSGIGGIVLLAALIWTRNTPARKPLPQLGWWAFALVQFQGLLGGLRVVLDSQFIGDFRMGMVFGIFHACLGQIFLVLLCVIALLTSRWWRERNASSQKAPAHAFVHRLALLATLLIFVQLIIGATMRHQHAGLAISDFPFAHGKLWPAMDADSIARYNAQRIELTAQNPITAFQVGLQMVHRIAALGIFVLVLGCLVCAIRNLAWRDARTRAAFTWFIVIICQVLLGAWTIWSNKAADVATIHVLFGAVSLVTGSLLAIISFWRVASFSESEITSGSFAISSAKAN